MTGVHADETMGMTGIVATVSGCGAFKTLNDEKGAADDLARWQSNCYSIPRAYSGASYQFCNLNPPPRSGPHWDALTVATDLALSGIADTLLLPYTRYSQYRHGDIKVRRKPY
ncbi:YceK/YidQ family lipoprotein [Pseudomonas californiensis]|uniref:YceK/YidQ family lipoprotein n=1 Tax=Pseudomonas californiensis TaxID=2829823 RepID=UPI001E62966E|nr:YceK/YidQ family lipoprotein [Pseudomonas californiensis]